MKTAPFAGEVEGTAPAEKKAEPTPLLTAALRYAALGWRVFFLHKSKVPLKGSHGFKDATCDPKEIRRVFDRHSGERLALAIAVPDGYVILDLDSNDDDALQILKARDLTLPATATQRTLHGRHFVYRLPPGVRVRQTVKQITPHVDTRSAGKGYIVVEPSEHYRWEVPLSEENISDAPEWLVSEPWIEVSPALQAPPPHHWDGSREDLALRARSYLARIPPAVEGQGGDAHTYRTCAALVRGFALTEEETLALLVGPSGESFDGPSWNDRCVPPWSTEELEKKIGNALKYGTHPIGEKLVASSLYSGANLPAPYGDLDRRLWLTERGNGLRLARKLGGHRLIFVPGVGWHRFEESEWVQADELAVQEAMRLSDDLLADIGQAISQGADAERVKAIAGWAKFCAKPSTGRATLEAAAGLPEVRVVSDELDRNPDLLNFKNGTVTLSTGKLRSHDPLDHLTYTIPHNYDPVARCPTWERFIEEVMNERPALVEFLPKAFGYSLSARQEEQCLFFLRGGGSNGKSTLLDTIEAACGRYVHRANETLLVARNFDEHPTEIADLRGRRIVITAEVGQQRKWNAQRIKNLVGERTLKARLMRRDYFTFSATHHLWVTSNHYPAVEENSHAFWRRMRVVPFDRKFAHNSGLMAELAAEIPGILVWLVAGFHKWEVEGLGEPTEVRTAVEDYRQRSDSLGLFLAQACVLGEQHQAQASELFTAYSAFCEERGFTRLSGSNFKTCLLDLGYPSRHAVSGTLYMGIRLRNGD